MKTIKLTDSLHKVSKDIGKLKNFIKNKKLEIDQNF